MNLWDDDYMRWIMHVFYILYVDIFILFYVDFDMMTSCINLA